MQYLHVKHLISLISLDTNSIESTCIEKQPYSPKHSKSCNYYFKL